MIVSEVIVENAPDSFDLGNFVGESPAIGKIADVVRKVAKTESTVLVTGESGTGKELISRAVHRNSHRQDRPLVVINCGAIPSELLESELFGHEKGAFTGAYRDRAGRFEIADGGTVFLDEIGDMSPDLQVKLLRVLQERCFERVGGSQTIEVDVRIISATNRDLLSAMKEGSFREDLYYRLNVIPIHLPPLRERKSDIPLLMDFFLRECANRMGQAPKTFSREAREIAVNYGWPGNVRELENMMERVSVLADGDIVVPEDLPEQVCVGGNQSKNLNMAAVDIIDSGIGFNAAVEQHQRELIVHALKKAGGVKARAAEILKMNRTTLVEKIKKMDIEVPEKNGPNRDFIELPVRNRTV